LRVDATTVSSSMDLIGYTTAQIVFQIHPETTFDHASQTVTALARQPEQIDLFTIGFDNTGGPPVGTPPTAGSPEPSRV
jgi:hypothetical protein